MMKYSYLVFFGLLLGSSMSAQASTPMAPFTSDGCSMFIDGPPDNPDLWSHCCVLHDYAYWKGQGGHVARLQADADLGVCVNEALGGTDPGSPVSGGFLMTIGTRLGGSGLWPSPFRWGYGWPYSGASRYNRVENVETLTHEIRAIISEYNEYGTLGGRMLTDSTRADEVIAEIKWDLLFWESQHDKFRRGASR
jgi:hypothetical protein